MILRVLVEEFGGNDGLNHVLQNARAQFLVGDILRMLSRNDDRIHAKNLSVRIVFHCDLGFAVRPEEGKHSVLANHESRCVSLCASAMGVGINSAFSFTAYPNIIPWSPAPPVSTPMAMSPDCLLMLEMTAQVLQSKPWRALSYPIDWTVPRTTCWKST